MTQQPALLINSQYIKDLSLEIPHAPQIFEKVTKQPELKVDLNVETSEIKKDTYAVDLNITMNADIEEEKLFILELTYSAMVTLTVPAEHLEFALNIEIPRLIFPFARNVISQVLMEGGLPPIMLTPIDFAALYAARHPQNDSSKEN